MKFFIIGSNSFSGANFINFLVKRNFDFIGVSRSQDIDNIFLPYKWEDKNKVKINNDKFNIYQIDLNKDLSKLMSLIDSYKPDFIINYAAQGMVAESWKNPTHWYTTNLLSQVAFHDELRKRTFLKKYIHITTPEVYGNTTTWAKENFNFAPSTPYAISRAACDLHLLSFFKAYNFPVIFTRAANVYGAGQQLYRIIPRTILSCLTGQKLKLHGGGYSERCFIHIDDVNAALMRLINHAETGTSWHISTKDPLSIRNLVKRICNTLNVEFEDIVLETCERLGKDKNYLLSSDSIRDKFDWEDKVSLEEGIKDTVKWIEGNFPRMLNMSWEYQHKK